MMLQALIFDIDGTFANTEEAHRCAFNEAFQKHGLGWHWDQGEYSELLRTTGGKERLAAHIDRLDLPSEEQQALRAQIGAIHATKTDLYTRRVRSDAVPLRDGVKRLIEEARRAGVTLAIATTTTLPNIDALLKTNLGSEALSLFSVIGAGDNVARKKPAPDIYEWVLRQLAVPAFNCIAIEDSAHGLAAAQGAGLFTLVTPSYWTQSEDFSSADWVLPSLSALSGLAELERRLALRSQPPRATFTG
jgi:beta-phosphoglucomutase-like phosphatase (HAD superfamily)